MIQTMQTVVERGCQILEGLLVREFDTSIGSDGLKALFGAVRHHLDFIWQFEEPEFEPPKAEFDWWDIEVVRPLEYAMNDFNPEDAPVNDDLWRVRAFACARESYRAAKALRKELRLAMKVAEMRRFRGIKYAPATVVEE